MLGVRKMRGVVFDVVFVLVWGGVRVHLIVTGWGIVLFLGLTDGGPGRRLDVHWFVGLVRFGKDLLVLEVVDDLLVAYKVDGSLFHYLILRILIDRWELKNL